MHITDKNISIIVAIGEKNEIGKDNNLLWHISGDLQRFKKITLGQTVIMGRNTYFSLPKGSLPNRTNIVITDNEADSFDGCIMASSVHDAVEKAPPGKEIFIIGGGSIYKQFLPLASKLYLTKVHASFDADIFFPEINFSEWEETENIKIENDGTCPFAYSFVTMVHRKTIL